MNNNFIAVIIGNAITIICFTAFSMHFNNPWLILGALFFFQPYEKVEPHEKKDI